MNTLKEKLYTEELELSNKIFNNLELNISKLFKQKINTTTQPWFSLLQKGIAESDGHWYLRFRINNWNLPNPDGIKNAYDIHKDGFVQINIDTGIFQWTELKIIDSPAKILNTNISWESAIKLRILYVIWKAYQTYCDMEDMKRFDGFWRRLYDDSHWQPIFTVNEVGALEADWKKL